MQTVCSRWSWNLLSNAITPQGGHIQVQLERINDHVQVTVMIRSGHQCWLLALCLRPFLPSWYSKQAGWIRTGIGDRASFDELHSGLSCWRVLVLGKEQRLNIKPLMGRSLPAILRHSQEQNGDVWQFRHHSTTWKVHQRLWKKPHVAHALDAMIRH